MTTGLFPKSLLLLSTLLGGQAALGQTATINTYAGNDALFADAGKPATSAQLVSPNNIAADSQGNVYFSDPGLSMVLKVSANGVISIVAGNGLTTGGGDGGLAIGASLLHPVGLAFDSSGNLFVADSYGSNVRKVDTNGIISTVAGGGGASGFAGDGGPATKALLSGPAGIAVDHSGNLYIADRLNNRVRMVTPGGIISTIAGSNASGFSGDGGPATKATFTYPTSIAIDAAGNLYIADTNNCAIRKISSTGIITTPRRSADASDGPAPQAEVGGSREHVAVVGPDIAFSDFVRCRKMHSVSGANEEILGSGNHERTGPPQQSFVDGNQVP